MRVVLDANVVCFPALAGVVKPTIAWSHWPAGVSRPLPRKKSWMNFAIWRLKSASRPQAPAAKPAQLVLPACEAGKAGSPASNAAAMRRMILIWLVRWRRGRNSSSRAMMICWLWASPLAFKSLRRANCWSNRCRLTEEVNCSRDFCKRCGVEAVPRPGRVTDFGGLRTCESLGPR